MSVYEPTYEPHAPEQSAEPEFQLDPRVLTLQSVVETPEAKAEAFGSIVEEYKTDLCRYAAKIVGPFTAEDVVQDTFLRAWRKVDTLKPFSERALPQWLYKITYNASLNQKRNEQTARLSKGPTALSPIGDPVATQEFHEDMASLSEIAETQKEALMLRVIFDFSPAEIAERQNVSLSAAKARLSRGRERAKSILRPEEELEAEESDAADEEPKAA